MRVYSILKNATYLFLANVIYCNYIQIPLDFHLLDQIQQSLSLIQLFTNETLIISPIIRNTYLSFQILIGSNLQSINAIIDTTSPFLLVREKYYQK